jgi:hypothetical protein
VGGGAQSGAATSTARASSADSVAASSSRSFVVGWLQFRRNLLFVGTVAFLVVIVSFV